MPFCSKCGFEVQSGDQFCGRCGEPQPDAKSAGPIFPDGTQPQPQTNPKPKNTDPFSTVNDTTVSVLCYIPFLGWIASIYVLSVDRFRGKNIVRFHAFQGLYLFVAWLIYDWVVEGILFDVMNRAWVITRVVRLGLTATWIYLMFKTSQREVVRLPVIADLADKSIAEQR